MWHTIERLRKQPERQRRAAAVSLAAGITAFIFFVWLSTFVWGGTEPDAAASGAADGARAETHSPLEVFSRQFDRLREDISGAFADFDRSKPQQKTGTAAATTTPPTATTVPAQ